MVKEKDNGTEKAILDAALKVFTEKGFAATRMDHIAKEAKINRALLHYYFRSKEKLFSLVFREEFKKLFTSIKLHCGYPTLYFLLCRIKEINRMEFSISGGFNRY